MLDNKKKSTSCKIIKDSMKKYKVREREKKYRERGSYYARTGKCQCDI